MREQIGLLFINDCKNNNRSDFSKFINPNQGHKFFTNITMSKIYKFY
jgi:hypothetical protein